MSLFNNIGDFRKSRREGMNIKGCVLWVCREFKLHISQVEFSETFHIVYLILNSVVPENNTA